MTVSEQLAELKRQLRGKQQAQAPRTEADLWKLVGSYCSQWMLYEARVWNAAGNTHPDPQVAQLQGLL